MATKAVRRLKFLRLEFFDDFSITTTESAAQDALEAFTALNDSLGFELKVTNSEWGATVAFLGVTVFPLKVLLT